MKTYKIYYADPAIVAACRHNEELQACCLEVAPGQHVTSRELLARRNWLGRPIAVKDTPVWSDHVDHRRIIWSAPISMAGAGLLAFSTTQGVRLLEPIGPAAQLMMAGGYLIVIATLAALVILRNARNGRKRHD